MDDMCGTNELQPYCEALRDFSKTSNFRRCCLEVLAWSLSNDDRAKVREYFLALDESNQGTITLQELKHIMVDKSWLGLCRMMTVRRSGSISLLWMKAIR